MLNIGLDLHKRESQVCVVDETGRIQWERRLPTTRSAFTAVFGRLEPARILLEAGTESEWVAQHLEGLGHEGMVADPNYAPMYSTRQRAVKTDRRDARGLAEACRLGAYRVVHRPTARQRYIQAELAVRESLVRTRTRFINLLRAQLRQQGLRLPSGDADHVLPRLARVALPPALAAAVAPLVAVLGPLQAELAAADARVSALAAEDPGMRHLDQVPSIGPVTAAAFVATAGRGQPLPERAPGPGVSRPDPSRAELRRAAAAGSDHQAREHPSVLALGGSRLAGAPLAAPGTHGAPGLGGAD